MSICRININNNMLFWAVERSGDSVANYAEKNAKFRSWLDGTQKPTLNELQKFAQRFYVPLGYLFLPTPPKEADIIPLFRASNNKKISLNIRDMIREMEDRQDWLSGYLRDQGFDKLDYVGIYHENAIANNISNKIRELLHLSVNWAFEHKTVEEALNDLTRRVEDKGAIVCFNSVVGFNTSRPISVAECRGFTLVDEYAPFIFINSKDAKSAQIFTLIHEFAHILTGYSAGIGTEDIARTSTPERLCDQVAAILLVDEELLKEEWNKIGENYKILSKRFKVSRFVIARRLKDIGLISERHYFALYNEWMDEPINASGDNKGGQFYATAIKKCSRTFLIHLNNAISSFKIQNIDAYRLVGLKGDTFRQVTNKIR